MKLVAGAASLALALHTVDAGFADMKKSYAKIMEQIRKSGDKRNLLAAQQNNPYTEVNNYGCWCYFDDQVGNGRGEPVDLIDAECKNLHKGYECAMADFPDCRSAADGGEGGALGHLDGDGNQKAPWIRKYIPADQELGPNDFDGDIGRACVFMNKALYGKCGAVVCAVELNFILQYGSVTNHVNLNRPAYSHPVTGAGNFNVEQSCRAQKDLRDRSRRECCGAYPERYGFKSMKNNPDTSLHQSCCEADPSTIQSETNQPLFPDGKVFNKSTHKCCFFGTVVPSANKCGPNE